MNGRDADEGYERLIRAVFDLIAEDIGDRRPGTLLYLGGETFARLCSWLDAEPATLREWLLADNWKDE